MVNIIVTGASGFIGKNLCQSLVDLGHNVLALGRGNTDYSYSDLKKKFSGFNILIHLAGKRLTKQTDMNKVSPFASDAIEMLDNILNAAHDTKIKKIITASTIGVYSKENNAPYDEDVELPLPSNPYGFVKFMLEQMVDMFGRKNNIVTSHIRLAACFGVGEKETPALMKFIKQARLKEEIELNNFGSYEIDQIYIKDAISAFVKLVNHDISGAFNIGANKGYTVKEIAETANIVFNNKGNILIKRDDNNVSISSTHMNTYKAHKKLNWYPEFTLEDAMKDMKKEYGHEKN